MGTPATDSKVWRTWTGSAAAPADLTVAQVQTLLGITGGPFLSVATAATTYLPLTGGTVTGNLTVNGTATVGGQLTPTGGIRGVTDGSDAAAGSVGEYVFNTASGPATSATTGTFVTLSLTAGDWDVDGYVGYANPTTASYSLNGGISTTTSLPGFGAFGLAQIGTPSASPSIANGTYLPIGTIRMSLAATTTIYGLGLVYFSSGTTTLYMGLRARRAR